MANLTGYFDPLCTWAWRGFLWLREVRKVRPVEWQLKLFSLREVHRGPFGGQGPTAGMGDE